jgi:hypothetical protein
MSGLSRYEDLIVWACERVAAWSVRTDCNGGGGEGFQIPRSGSRFVGVGHAEHRGRLRATRRWRIRVVSPRRARIVDGNAQRPPRRTGPRVLHIERLHPTTASRPASRQGSRRLDLLPRPARGKGASRPRGQTTPANLADLVDPADLADRVDLLDPKISSKP